MRRGNTLLNEIDSWVSMLENWADSVKEFKRECLKKDLSIAQCLPQMSKNLDRMVDAMKLVWQILPRKIKGNDNFRSGLAEITPTSGDGIRGWYSNVKRKVSIAHYPPFKS
jgi:hypothetical protein